jgi:DNA-binding MarR family transcriptional regulator
MKFDHPDDKAKVSDGRPRRRIERRAMRKADDPRIILYGLLDQTREAVSKAVELELGQYQMSAPQVKIMHMLAQGNGGMTLSELAIGTVRELNSISTLIARMQNKGLVDKVKKTGDDKTYVALSDRGKDIYNNTITERAIYLIFDALSEAEKRELAALLGKLQSKARALLGLDYKPPFLA